jgi:NAD+ diphosphatase
LVTRTGRAYPSKAGVISHPASADKSPIPILHHSPRTLPEVLRHVRGVSPFIALHTLSLLIVRRYTNFLGGSPLNRLSWLRTSQPFLHAILDLPSTRWLVFNAGQPLLTPRRKLARLRTPHVAPLLGPAPHFGQGEHAGDVADAGAAVLEAARLRGPPIVFLGLHEGAEAGALPSSDFSGKVLGGAEVARKVSGTPWFALDVSEAEQDAVDAMVRAASEELGEGEGGGESKLCAFGEPRGAMSHMDMFEAAVSAEARSMLDWNVRNKVRV